ncbi:MAG TPA: hypothetical protein VF306_15140, partial [Pirellulales bacterium]
MDRRRVRGGLTTWPARQHASRQDPVTVKSQEEATGGELAVTDHPAHTPGGNGQPTNGHAPSRLTIVELHEVRSLNNQLSELTKMGFDIQSLIPQQRT